MWSSEQIMAYHVWQPKKAGGVDEKLIWYIVTVSQKKIILLFESVLF